MKMQGIAQPTRWKLNVKLNDNFIIDLIDLYGTKR